MKSSQQKEIANLRKNHSNCFGKCMFARKVIYLPFLLPSYRIIQTQNPQIYRVLYIHITII